LSLATISSLGTISDASKKLEHVAVEKTHLSLVAKLALFLPVPSVIIFIGCHGWMDRKSEFKNEFSVYRQSLSADVTLLKIKRYMER
jgi:hypothetical protein